MVHVKGERRGNEKRVSAHAHSRTKSVMGLHERLGLGRIDQQARNAQVFALSGMVQRVEPCVVMLR